MEHHITKVKERCRVCGRFLVEAREKKTRSSYICQEFAADLYTVFTINTSNDIVNTHPPCFCYRCKLVLDKCLLYVAQDQQQLTPFRSIVPFEWKPHTAVDCGICHPNPLRDKTSPPCGRPATHSPQKIIAGIRAIAPPTESLQDDHLLGSSNNPAILEQLQCPICLKILHQPLELPCRALVCTACLIEWFKVFNCSGVKCPCCFHDTPITAPQLKAAPLLIQTLLRDIVLQCQTCRKDIKACEPALLPRQQVPGPSSADACRCKTSEKWWLKASGVSISCEEKMRQIARGLLGENLQGEVTPLSFCLSSGGEEIRGAPLVFMPDLNQKVIQMLDDNHSVGRLTWHNGIIPQTEVWVKLGGDKGGNTTKMNLQIVNVPTPNSIHNTCVFCCFAATDSVTSLHSALDRYRDQVKQLQGTKWREYTIKVFMCGDFEFLTRMYGLSGATGKYPCLICEIPQKQMAVPLSLRKRYPLRSLKCIKESHKQFMAAGGKRKKVKNYMNCVTEPIFDIPIDQVCLPGLHITQGIFVKIFDLLEDACHQLDLQLAYTYTEESSSSSSFTKYVEELHKLQVAKAKLAEAQDAMVTLEEAITYIVIAHGEDSEITEFLMQQAEDMRQSVEKMVDNSIIKKALCMIYMLTIITKHKQQEEMANTTKVTNKEFAAHDGPFVQGLDNALQSFGVHRQQYFGGTFVGNHIHKALKPSNVECLSSCMVEVAKAKCPALVASATREQTRNVADRLNESSSVYLYTDRECESQDSDCDDVLQPKLPPRCVQLYTDRECEAQDTDCDDDLPVLPPSVQLYKSQDTDGAHEIESIPNVAVQLKSDVVPEIVSGSLVVRLASKTRAGESRSEARGNIYRLGAP
eukprot:Em0001g3359a